MKEVASAIIDTSDLIVMLGDHTDVKLVVELGSTGIRIVVEALDGSECCIYTLDFK